MNLTPRNLTPHQKKLSPMTKKNFHKKQQIGLSKTPGKHLLPPLKLKSSNSVVSLSSRSKKNKKKKKFGLSIIKLKNKPIKIKKNFRKKKLNKIKISPVALGKNVLKRKIKKRDFSPLIIRSNILNVGKSYFKKKGGIVKGKLELESDVLGLKNVKTTPRNSRRNNLNSPVIKIRKKIDDSDEKSDSESGGEYESTATDEEGEGESSEDEESSDEEINTTRKIMNSPEKVNTPTSSSGKPLANGNLFSSKSLLSSNENLNNFKIKNNGSESEYKIIKKIGAGGFSTVFLAVSQKTGINIAVKRIKIEEKDQSMDIQKKELKFLTSLSHDHIIKCFGFDIKEICFVKYIDIYLEYASQGTIKSFFLDIPTMNQKIFCLQSFLKQILHGLDYLHLNAVVHRDIKPSNILLSPLNGKTIVKLTGKTNNLF